MNLRKIGEGAWRWTRQVRRHGAAGPIVLLLSLLPAACAYRGAIDEPLTQKLTWFSYLAGSDIRAGLPEIGAELRDQLLPQWIGLDRLGAISVRKGCYPGQEIMARLHFKGGNKRSLYRLLWPAGEVVPPGTRAAVAPTSTRSKRGSVAAAPRARAPASFPASGCPLIEAS